MSMLACAYMKWHAVGLENNITSFTITTVWDKCNGFENLDVSTLSPAAAAIELQQRIYEGFNIESELSLSLDHDCIVLSFALDAPVKLYIEPCDNDKAVARLLRFNYKDKEQLYSHLNSITTRIGAIVMMLNSERIMQRFRKKATAAAPKVI